ncbi:MAG: choice-of-anchor Q domain-containing protein, partial [Myxococcales bacterium]|nr:choice-of-anchor Q domain-containing protein [Myxococcales bacterium]
GGSAAGGSAAGGSAAGGSAAGGSAAGGSAAGGSAAGGSAAGGSAAGGSAAGGSAAGGSAAGGSAAGGSAAGGSAGGAAVNDAYVCGNCPGANNSNPGTRNSPVSTIGRGIQLATMNNGARVYVAARFGGATVNYSEDVTMVEGRSLEGRWSVTGSAGNFTWTRNGPRTSIRNTAATGLKFPAGLTAATSLDGFSIEKSGPGLVGGRVTGITITQSAPVVRDFDVAPPQIAIGTAADAIGIDVLGTMTAPAAPSLQGGGPANSTVNAGSGSTSSVGLAGLFARVTVAGVDFRAENGGTTSAGVFIISSPGSTFTRGTYTAGAANSCFGFASSGEASGTRVEGVTAVGCPRVANVMNVPRFGVGVLFDNCPALSPGSGNPIVRNVTATGGVVGGNNSSAVGGAALDGCAVRFEGTAGSSATFTGASQAPAFGMGPENTVGIACSFAGFRNPNGFDARCSISGVSAFGGFVSAPNSIGLACDGTCGNQPASCRGSCDELANNTFSAASGTQMNHVLLRNSSPSLRANRLGVGGNGITCGNNATVVGMTLQGSAASVINNLIVGGPCLTSIGVSNQLAQRSDGSTPSANFHSNTIVSRTSGGGSPSLNSIGAQLVGPAGSATALVGSTWRNNIFFAGPAQGSGSVAVAFRETSTGADPATLGNNLFFTDSPSLNPPLYFDEGTTALTTTAAINGLMGSSGNVAGDPDFVNAGNGNYAPASPSPARAAGTTTGAPAVDLNGASRPNPVGSNPDIGCIEVN